MDIRAGIVVIALFTVVAAFFSIRAAIQNYQSARKISFYSLRKRYNRNSFYLFLFSIFLFFFAYWLPTSGEPLVYQVFPPSSTASLTPTIDRKSTRLNSSHSQISYAVFCLKKKKI